MTFPVAGIDRLDEGAESVEVVQFADSCNFILDAARKFIVELLAKESVAPIDFLVIMNFELFKLILSISFNIEWAEVGLESRNEFGIVVGPSGIAIWAHE